MSTLSNWLNAPLVDDGDLADWLEQAPFDSSVSQLVSQTVQIVVSLYSVFKAIAVIEHVAEVAAAVGNVHVTASLDGIER